MALTGVVGGANSQVVVTLTPPTSPPALRQVLEIDCVHWSLSADPAAGVLLTITSTGSPTYSVYVSRGGPGTLDFQEPYIAVPNTPIVVTLASAGGTVVGTLNVFSSATPSP